MAKKLTKNLVALALCFVIIAPAFALALPAVAANELNVWGNNENAIQNATGLGNRNPQEIAAAVINVIMGFLGIVAVVIILIGGFKWMTAGGNEEKVSEARKLITAGIIGLVIILASFAIAKFVLDQLLNATNANS